LPTFSGSDWLHKSKCAHGLCTKLPQITNK
jgi:hypothetical protein